jgi:hypothetical protein
VVQSEAVPFPPNSKEWIDRAAHAFALWKFLRGVNQRAGLNAREFDARIYVALNASDNAGLRWVEGVGEQGGEVGLVRATLDDDNLTLALCATAHELFHTLGATDKYDADGHADAPRGLVEPQRAPPYPQSRAEIMVGEVPLGPSSGRLPSTLDDVAVGPATAAELNW